MGLITSEGRARPPFAAVFAETYERNYVGKEVKTDSCLVCHYRPDGLRLLQNQYAEAMSDVLSGGSFDKSSKREIERLLRETEARPSAIEGLTFGDLINVGCLPATR